MRNNKVEDRLIAQIDRRNNRRKRTLDTLLKEAAKKTAKGMKAS